MNKILVPVDFSDTSLNALNFAIHLFGDYQPEITIFYSYKVSRQAGYLKSMDMIFKDDAKREMDAFRSKIDMSKPGIVFKELITKGDAVSTIANLGKEYDIIVMGTKGASGLKEVFIGSVAGGVITKTNAPVLVVPGEYKYKAPKNIVLAVCGQPLSDESVLQPLHAIAALCDSKIKVLHIADEETPSLKEVLSAIGSLDYSVVYKFGSSDVNQRINKFLEESNSELLCLIRRKRGFFKRIMGDSVTLKQTFNCSIPLLVLHN